MNRGILFTQHFGINADEETLEFFDVNLKYDQPLFIDPFLLKRSPNEEEKDLYGRLDTFFTKVVDTSIKLKSGASEYKKLKELLHFKEPKEINLGYTAQSNDGKGLASRFAKELSAFFLKGIALKLVKDKTLYPDGLVDPDVLLIFIDKVGPDAISDLTANLIMDYLVKFTQEQCKKHGVAMNEVKVGESFDFEEMNWTGGFWTKLPLNPFKKGEAVILVPKRLLRSEKFVNKETKSRVKAVLTRDLNLSMKFSDFINKKLEDIKTEDIRTLLTSENTVLSKLVDMMSGRSPKSYDFTDDPEAFLALKRYENIFPTLTKPIGRGCANLANQVLIALNEAKHLYEKKSLWKDCWRGKGKITEPAWTRLIFALLYIHFSPQKDIDVRTESNTGVGLVDIHISRGECKVLIELKWLSNSSPSGPYKIPAYLHGVTVQLPLYIESEKAQYGFYLTGLDDLSPDKNLSARINEINGEIPKIQSRLEAEVPTFKKLSHVTIDVSKKLSASKA